MDMDENEIISYRGMGKGSNPKSIEAIKNTMRKKGEPPPPGAGRPKGCLSLKERLNKYLSVEVKTTTPDGTVVERSVLDDIVLALLTKAREGNISAIKEVLDRSGKSSLHFKDLKTLEDKAGQVFTLTSDGEIPTTDGMGLSKILLDIAAIREKEKIVTDVEELQEIANSREEQQSE